MPRVLILGEFSTLNGGERSLLAVLPAIQSAGWTVDAYVPADGPFAESLRQRGVVIRAAVPGPRLLEERRDDLHRLLRTETYDLLHANSLAMGRMAGPVAAAANVPSLAHLRDIIGLNKQSIADLNQNTRLVAVSHAVREFHLAQGLRADRVHVLHNGVDLAVFRPVPAGGECAATNGLRNEFGFAAEAQVIVLIGQIILRKGQDVALAAAIDLLRERPQVRVLVIGTRHSNKPETIDYEHRLHELVRADGIAERVRFVGTRDDLPTLLPQATLLLHTARQEPLGRVLLEAAACSVPVVATDVGGTREIFPRAADDGALLVPVDDRAAAQDAVARVLDDDPFRIGLGRAGRQRMEAAFSVERSAAGLLAHYQAVARLRTC